MGITQAWGATAAPSGLRNQSSLSYAAADTLKYGGKTYEVYWCNSTSSSVKTAMHVKTYGATTTMALSATGWAFAGSSVGNTSSSATAGSIDEFTWASQSYQYMRLRASNQANYQLVLVVKGYAGVAALHKANTNFQIVVEKWNSATEEYVSYTPTSTSTSTATSSHYK